ncbi:MAG: plastocyanin/azurin family copper-binding protein [Solirubrobacterales bacterium]
MKKLAVLLALLIAAVALVACGSSSSSNTTEETSPAAGAAKEAEETVEEAGKEAEEKAGEAEKEAGGGGASLEIEANPEGNLEFTSSTETAKAGKVTVDFTNESVVPHDVAIESEGGETVGKTEVISEGSDSTTVNLKPGTYKYFCTIPGHRQAGMEGTLTVK